uniref:FCP1 homology domain-containing protein n=1 Tax=viral metagenome TaxID=1070528 RepID=A0A6C0HGV8_9ZZZZ
MQTEPYMGDLVKIFPGRFRPTNTAPSKQKVIVFDLDETLGYFSDLVSLWYIIALKKTQQNFNALLDQYPEFLRYGILTILEYLHHKKHAGHCYKVYLYTNNRYSPEIPRYIAKYFDYKMGIYKDMNDLSKTHLFDKVICAFKVGNRIVEPCRTTQKKTHGDFIRCTLLPKNTEICFVDDVYHHRMHHHKIYYIQPAEYRHNLSKDEIINRACAFMPDVYKRDYLQHVLYNNGQSHANKNELNIHVSQKLMYYIKEFFYLSSIHAKTRKSKTRLGRGTRKR